MRGSRVTDPINYSMVALLGGIVAACSTLNALAADGAVGPPTSLLQPTAAPAPPVAAASPLPRSAVSVPSPGKHPTMSVSRAPLVDKPLIPPATIPAKLGPPPEPHAALPLETDLQPLGTSPAPGQTESGDQASPPAAKPQ